METSQQGAFTQMMHVGVVVKDLDKTIARLSELGIGPWEPRTPKPEEPELFRGKPFIPAERVKIKSARMGNMEIELIQPLEGPSPHREFLEKKGEGIQHLGFFVKDLKAEVQDLTQKGCEVLLESHFKAGGGITYLDLNAADLIVEIVQPKPRQVFGP